jgi:hypothetical protein
MTTGLVTVMDCRAPATVLTLFKADTMKVYGVGAAVVGTPDNRPELEFNVNPRGSVPEVTEKVVAGVPVAT